MGRPGEPPHTAHGGRSGGVPVSFLDLQVVLRSMREYLAGTGVHEWLKVDGSSAVNAVCRWRLGPMAIPTTAMNVAASSMPTTPIAKTSLAASEMMCRTFASLAARRPR